VYQLGLMRRNSSAILYSPIADAVEEVSLRDFTKLLCLINRAHNHLPIHAIFGKHVMNVIVVCASTYINVDYEPFPAANPKKVLFSTPRFQMREGIHYLILVMITGCYLIASVTLIECELLCSIEQFFISLRRTSRCCCWSLWTLWSVRSALSTAPGSTPSAAPAYGSASASTSSSSGWSMWSLVRWLLLSK
jgi:hypothetical protein